MRILLTHSDFIEYEAKKKAIESAEPIEVERHRIEECLVVFTSAEEGDDDSVVTKTVKEVNDIAHQVGAKAIVVYPFVHLSSKPAKPALALEMLGKMEHELKKGHDVYRAPFGWYKSFTLKCKGHPLSELSREIKPGAADVKVEKVQPKLGKIILDRRNLPPNDHRILGEDLKIFHLSEEIGAGLPLWMPNGETIRYLLMEYMRKVEEQHGYKYVSTPHITRGTMYERTGHLPYYKDTMFAPMDIEGEDYFLKPMNCPHHHMIFNKLVESYRDLPLRLAEPGMTYRNELSGVTYGLIRVKCFTQNDSHIYTTPDQLRGEFVKVLELFREVYEVMGIKDYWFRLSLPDFKGKSDKFTGDPKKWEHACDEIRAAMQQFGAKYTEESGEAAFYGPKIDVQIKNTLGKEETIATSQVDIVVPERIGLTYVDGEGNKKHPIVIHRAILGSYERFIAYLLEQTEGKLPLWLSPVQVKIISITDRTAPLVEEMAQKMIQVGIRAEPDTRQNTLQYKIRDAEVMKVPYILVIGDQEKEKGTIAIRTRGVKQQELNAKLDDFIQRLLDDIRQRK